MIVGYADPPAGYARAFRWSRQSGISDLRVGGSHVWVSSDGCIISWGSTYWVDGLALQLPYSIQGMYTNGRGILAEVSRSDCWYEFYSSGCFGNFLLLTTPLVGDLNNDGRVDDVDLLIVIFNFGADCR